MCFITAGMGGGTGTGGAPIIAQAARELGVLTVGVETKPFQFEGVKRMRQAEEGIDALQKVVDTLIIIPNQNLFRLATENTTFTEAFALADDVLYQGVKGVTDLMVRPGLINLDFADVRSVMDEMGKAMMGTGEAVGDNRAIEAAEKAISNPLLDGVSMKGAKGVLINITGGYDMTLFELDEAANKIREMVDEDANIIVGSTLDTDMGGRMRVSVVATGIDASASRLEPPMPRRSMNAPGRVDEQPQRVSAPQPSPVSRTVAPQAQPVARQPAPQPAPAPRPAPEPFAEERSFEPRSYHQEPEIADDLPPPASRPTPAPVQRAEPVAEAAPSSRPAPGTPTPEALARLRAMANRAAESQRGAAQGGAAAPQGEKPRFGINSLINRMTGQPAGEGPAPAPAPAAAAGGAAPAQRPQPRYEAQPEAEQERADIPAFLRRQAN